MQTIPTPTIQRKCGVQIRIRYIVHCWDYENKKYILAEILPSKIREEYSTVFGFQKNATLCSYVQKKGKAVIMLSSMHVLQ